MGQTDLAHRETLTALVGTYNQAMAEIEQAYAILAAAQGKLKSAFLGGFASFDVIRRNSTDPSPEEAKKVLAGIKRQAWMVIVDRLEIRRILSISRREKLDQQLYEEKSDLPDITEENVMTMLQDGMAKSTEYAQEAVFEIFDWLRPRNGRNANLKTNEKWRVGKKVIVSAVERKYTRGFQVRYHRQNEVTALDNVFHMLDGRGPLKTHHGPLHDAIDASGDGTGETDFFRFRCCKNGNIHIEFKRMDLVAKINKMAGGNRLKGV